MHRVIPDRRWITALVVFFLTSCAPVTPPAATSIPTQRIWEVTYPPETAWMVELFDDCLQSEWNTGIVIQEVMDAELVNDPGTVQFMWGDVDPQDLSAYQLGMDTIRVVAHPGSTVQQISLDQLHDVLSGSIREWSELDPDASGELHG